MDGREATLAELLSRISPCDLVLVEGFKTEAHVKLEVHRRGLGKPLLADEDPRIIAVAGDAPTEHARVPWLDLDDAAGIARLIVERAVPFLAS